MDAEMPFHRKDGRGGIFDDGGNEAPSFRLKIEEPDIDMTGVIPKKERETEYSMYTDKGRQIYFYFLKQKGTKLKETAAAANVNHHTARKWKQQERKVSDGFVLHRMTNLGPT